MTSSAPIISAIITFTIYGKFVATPEDPLTAAKAFVSLAYFNMYEHPEVLPPYDLGVLDLWWFDQNNYESLLKAGALR